jgi:hypothetical protein
VGHDTTLFRTRKSPASLMVEKGETTLAAVIDKSGVCRSNDHNSTSEFLRVGGLKFEQLIVR